MMGTIGRHHLEQLSKRHFLTASNNNRKYINNTYLQYITDSTYLQYPSQVARNCGAVNLMVRA